MTALAVRSKSNCFLYQNIPNFVFAKKKRTLIQRLSDQPEAFCCEVKMSRKTER